MGKRHQKMQVQIWNKQGLQLIYAAEENSLAVFLHQDVNQQQNLYLFNKGTIISVKLIVLIGFYLPHPTQNPNPTQAAPWPR